MRYVKYLLTTLVATLPFCTQATTLGQRACIGLSTTDCPGTIDIVTGDTGTLLAQNSAPVWRYNAQTGTESVIGYILSSVFQEQPNTDGHFNPLTFYYQFSATALPLPMHDFRVEPSTIGRSKFPMDAGLRTDAVGEMSTSNLLATSVETTGFGWQVNFSTTPVAANSTTSILVLHTTNTGYNTDGFGMIDSIPDQNGSLEGFTTNSRAGIIMPDTAPEPSTIFLMGGGLFALGFWQFRKRKMHATNAESATSI
jgi:hypothetical protein